MKKRKQHTAEFKTKVVLEVMREEQTINEIAAKYELNPVMIKRWKSEFLDYVLPSAQQTGSKKDYQKSIWNLYPCIKRRS